MAESAVSFVIEKLVKIISEEAIFLHGVIDKIQAIKGELEFMRSFLKDADAKKEQDELAKKWVAELREAAYDVEDIIDIFLLQVSYQNKQSIMSFVKRYACISNKIILLHKIGKKIEAIYARIQDISRLKSTYGISIPEGDVERTTSNEIVTQIRRSSSYSVDDDEVFGLTEIDKLVAQLKKEEQRRCVISIVGMGGLGKTTLARKIYNHTDVKGHFDCRVWISASKEYSTNEILRGIMSYVSSPSEEEWRRIDRIRGFSWERKVREFLETKRYLVVLDDIWNTKTWIGLKNALPDTKNKSRLMLTTRHKDVAMDVDSRTYIHELQLLNENESWKLLYKKAVPESHTTSCSQELEKLGRAMVEKCGRLPLALVVLGGVLMKKNNSPDEWEKVLNNIHTYLNEQNGFSIMGVLSLSYTDLPYRLKSCFLYLGLFPEDFKINVTKLIQYWTMDGIISQEEQGTLTKEEVSVNYLNELINRSLIQVVERTTKHGRAKACLVHDLLRNLSISKAKEENFLEIIDGNFNSEAFSKSMRRCSVHSEHGFGKYYNSATATATAIATLQQHFPSYLRTLTFFPNNYNMSLRKEHMEFICRHCKLLRVLDLGDVRIKCLPRAIGNLIHLQYLSLNVQSLESQIPSSIGNLQNLQHLQISTNAGGPKGIPNVIWKMEGLKNLFILGWLSSLNLRIDTLRDLQSLRQLHADDWINGENGSWANLKNLTDLRIHGITSLSKSHVEVLFHSFSELNLLQSLHLQTDHYYDKFPSLAPLSKCHIRLHKLNLQGAIENLNNPNELPPNLTKLTLCDSNLKQGSMKMLANLQHLRILLLHRESYMQKKLVFVANGFPQLQVLELTELHELEKWIVEEGALVMLKRLVIDKCSNLEMVPEELKFLDNLKELVIRNMPAKFKDKVRGDDSYFVQPKSYSITFK